MSRSEIHQSFVERFATRDGPRLFTSVDILEIERHFRVCLPLSYRRFSAEHGSIRSHRLLGLIVDQEVPLSDIAQFWTPKEVIADTDLFVSGGMSPRLLGFASDSMGNLFGFARAEILTGKDDAAVWLFDHEFCTEELIADSFDSWLARYLELEDARPTPPTEPTAPSDRSSV